MAKRCPSCRTEVADDARVCPNCPWSFPEEEQENLPASAVATGWSPLPLVITALVAAGIGLGWYFVVKVYREETVPEQAAHAPVRLTPAQPAPQPAPTKTTRPAPSKPGKAVQPVPAVNEDDEDELPAVTIIKEPPPKKVKSVKEWKLRGFVYDLLTLKPVPSCKITLSDLDTNAHFETATDAAGPEAGRYRAILPPLPDRGYLIDIAAPGYVTAYLNPGTEGIRHKSAGERQELCKELGTAVLQPSSLQPHGADPLITDFFIAPVSCR